MCSEQARATLEHLLEVEVAEKQRAIADLRCRSVRTYLPSACPYSVRIGKHHILRVIPASVCSVIIYATGRGLKPAVDSC